MKMIVVQKGTLEGYAAAWVAKRQLKGDCEIAFMGAGDPVPAARGMDQYFFGISFARSIVQRLAKEAIAEHREFRMFDNDYKAHQELSGIKEVKVNQKHTPARMAWEFLRADFKVQVGPGKVDFRFTTAPWIVDYSENEKLWKWPAIKLYFLKLAIENCYKLELESWDELATRDLTAVVDEGMRFSMTQQQPEEKQEETPDVKAEPRKTKRVAR